MNTTTQRYFIWLQTLCCLAISPGLYAREPANETASKPPTTPKPETQPQASKPIDLELLNFIADFSETDGDIFDLLIHQGKNDAELDQSTKADELSDKAKL